VQRLQHFLSGCNTGLGRGTLPQNIANSSGCKTYGSKSYLTGSQSCGDERCTHRSGSNDIYPGSIDGKGRGVWAPPFYPSLPATPVPSLPGAILLPPISGGGGSPSSGGSGGWQPIKPPVAILLPPISGGR
jgi:hypothetical protein